MSVIASAIRRVLGLAGAATLAQGLAADPAAAAEERFNFGGAVEAGDVFRLRLTGLPAGAGIVVGVETAAPARFLMLGRADMLAWPDIDAPLHDARVEKKAVFGVTVPDDGNYFLVVDNREGDGEAEFRFVIVARSQAD